MAWSDLSVVALAQVNWTATKTLDLSSVVDSDNKQIRESLDFGTGAGKANQVWHDTRTLAASASEDLDLAGGREARAEVAVVPPARDGILHLGCGDGRGVGRTDGEQARQQHHKGGPRHLPLSSSTCPPRYSYLAHANHVPLAATRRRRAPIRGNFL